MKPAVTLLAALAFPAHAQVYTCKEGSSTVYSSQPCGANARAIEVKPASGAVRPPAPIPRAADLTIGMEAASAARAWGEPSRVNRSTTARGKSEQWVYRDGHVTRYLYFTNGKLTAIYD